MTHGSLPRFLSRLILPGILCVLVLAGPLFAQQGLPDPSFASRLNSLPGPIEIIGVELRNQFVLACRPANHTRDGLWRKIRVTLVPPRGLPPLKTYFRTGYFAPSR
jgi:hypothetical protein